MAAVPARRRYTVEEYFEIDAHAPEGVRYEYWDGYIIPQHGYEDDGITAMAGAEPQHNVLKGNVERELGNRLVKRGCRVMSSDQRVLTGPRYVYPDVVASCKPEYDDSRPRILINPDLIVDVASLSTGEADRAEKLTAYTQIESLKEYWIAASDRVQIVQYVRHEDGWRVYFHTHLDADLYCPTFDFSIPMDALYALVLDAE